MAKNLTEVIGTIEKDQRKEFFQATLNKGKMFVIVNAILYDIWVIFCFLAALKSRSINQITCAYLSKSTFVFRKKYNIKKSFFNIIDIKLHFLYTILLNCLNPIDQIVNLYIQSYYQNLGPFRAFNIWWLTFVWENLGECQFSKPTTR